MCIFDISYEGNEANTTTGSGLSRKSGKIEKTSWAKQSHAQDFRCIFPRKYESLFLQIELGLDVLVSEILNP